MAKTKNKLTLRFLDRSQGKIEKKYTYPYTFIGGRYKIGM